MMFRIASLVTLLAATCSGKELRPGATISAESTAGHRLLSKARALNDGDRDVTFVANYDIKYTGCSSLVQVREEADDEQGLLYTQNLVKFSLCPSSDSCSKCEGGGEYVVNMADFINAYTEFKMNDQEQACENAREYICYACENANDDESCYNNCYAENGMDYCVEYEGDEEFQIQEYIECVEMEDGGDDNNNNNNANGNYYNNGGGDNYYGQYFVGPYCSEEDGFSIFLGVFYDEGCSARGSADAYASRNYGATLPFSEEPIVDSGCISCMQVDENNNNNNDNNNNQELEVNELCGEVYEMSAKCEQNMDVYYPDSNACDYIQNTLPKLERATRQVAGGKSSGGSGTVAFAWIFALTTLAMGSYSFFLYRKLSGGKVDLSGSA